jgi:itaconate CoA-transferase
MVRPLDGITVVTLEHAIAAPFCTRQLADMGARVIKIERPGSGDFARAYDERVLGQASHFVWTNRSKESLTLDVKHAEAQQVLAQLLAGADVLVQNLAPGAAARLGLSHQALEAVHPRLIVCDISGYGDDPARPGPYRDKKAYDLLIQSETGMLSITGTDATPSKVGISVADIAGGMYAFSAILTALFLRERTGQGTAIELSLFEALAEWMGYPAYYTAYGGTAPRRSGASHAAIAPYGPFQSGDGKTVYLGIQNEREWQSFCSVVIERPELASDVRFDSNSRRVEHRDQLHAEIEAVFLGLRGDQIIERLERASIANARMNTIVDFLNHPQLAARDRWRMVDSPVGPVKALVPPATLSGVEPVMNPIPAVGQHTEGILADMGFDAETISCWRSKGVI